MTYSDFCNLYKEKDFIWIKSKEMDIGGGIVRIEDINTLDEFDNIDKVMISGLRQDTFEYFISKYGKRIKFLKFFKNKMVEDFSLLSSLENVEYIDFFINQRATNLWNMSNNKHLCGLAIDDFTRLHSLKGIETAPSLEYLHFGDKIWRKSILTDLDPLLKTKLVGFSFNGKAIENNDILILSKIKSLKHFNCPTNLYTTEDIAKLVATFPQLEGYALRPYVKFDRECIQYADILICGKRKPFLYSDKDKNRIDNYAKKFYELVEYYKHNVV